MTMLGYLNGNTNYMLAPIMTGGLVCGHSPGVENLYRLYVPDLKAGVDPITNFFVDSTCIDSCPSGPDSTLVCFDQAACDAYTPYDTYEVVDYCIPSASSLADVYSKKEDGSFTTSNYFLSMYESRWVILTCIGISLVLALIYLKLMDWFAVPIAWLTIIVIELSLIALGYFSYSYSGQVKDTMGESTTQSETLFWSGIALWAVAALYYLVLCCNFRALKISIAVIETAADFFSDTKRIAFVPLFYFAVWCGIFIFWLWGLCGVASITGSEIRVTSVQF